MLPRDYYDYIARNNNSVIASRKVALAWKQIVTVQCMLC